MTDLFTGSNRWLRSSLALPLVALNAWVFIQIFQYLEPLVTIFVVAAVFAFVLNYPVELLQQRGVNRSYAIFSVLLVSLVALATLGVTLLPALLEQLSAIATQLPDWLDSISEQLQGLQSWASSHRLPVNLNRVIQQFTERFPTQLEGLGNETISLTLTAAGGLSSALITLVLTFYLLVDGKRIWDAFFRFLPLERRDRIRRSLQSDFRSYFIGQATLGLIMSIVLTVTLLILRVPYSLALGFTVGVMTLIPFGDLLGYLLVWLLTMAHSPRLAFLTLGILVVLDQVIDQAIAPRILGNFTGLKPIWVIVALLLGTKLFGFSGLLLAVPLASFINSLLEDDLLSNEETAAVEGTPKPSSTAEPVVQGS